MSIWLWILYIEIKSFHGFYDDPRHIWLKMNLTSIIVGVVVPRIIIIITHFSGKLKKGWGREYINWLTNSGLTAGAIIFFIILTGTLHGRFRVVIDKVTINIKGLDKRLDGLRIVQLSDLHLAGFYHNRKLLVETVETVNSLKPDFILNTGDFVNFGWREFGREDTIFSKSVSTLGNFAVLGNHDFGTYHPDFTEADKENNVLIMTNKIKASGYTVLSDENCVIEKEGSRIGIIGITTKGRHPGMIHGNLKKAMTGLDSVNLKILLSHDPNEWELDVVGKTDIDLTLSGHTHGMQMGIYTSFFKWSPSKYFYPHWSGLYKEGEQYQYVNRGLGVLSITFRFCMPPEITLITLRSM